MIFDINDGEIDVVVVGELVYDCIGIDVLVQDSMYRIVLIYVLDIGCNEDNNIDDITPPIMK